MPGQVPSPTDYASVTDYLYALKAGGVKFGIDRMRRLAEALGHPERSYPVIHVAGTNGKGSVSAMLEAILRAAGRRTGLYTSPHLVRLGERVQVDRRALTEGEIGAFVAELRPVAEKLAADGPDEHPSFFEFMTAMAFLQFQRRKVDVAVVEVGMGGRLDATNVVQPEVAVITSIGLDHCEQLGDTLEKIAAEKAGIVKPGRPVVIGRMPPEAETTIRTIAAERAAPVHAVREAYGDTIERYPVTNLECEYQRWNAATATLAAGLLPAAWKIGPEIVTAGLRAVNWPGRWQRLRVGGKRVILDASHNPEGAQMLDASLRRLVAETGRAPVIVAGVLGEFRARALLEVVARHAREIYLTPPHQQRASSYDELEAALPTGARARARRATLAEVFPAPGVCAVGAPGDTVVITGSIYLLGEVLARIEPERGAEEARLQDF